MILESDVLSYKDNKVQEATQKNEELFAKKKESLTKEKETSLAKFKAKNPTEEEFKAYEETLERESALKLAKYESKLKNRIKRVERRADAHVKNIYAASKRVFEIDLLRGIIIIGMIIDHTLYNFSEGGLFDMFYDFHGYQGLAAWIQPIHDFASWFYPGDVRIGIRLIGIFGLLFLTGISSRFAKNNLRRSLIIFGVGVLMTVGVNVIALVSNNPEAICIIGTIAGIGLSLLTYHGLRILYIFIYNKIKESKFLKESKEGKYGKNPMPLSWAYICLGVFVIGSILWLTYQYYNYTHSFPTDFEVPTYGVDENVYHTGQQFWEHLYHIYNGNGHYIGWGKFTEGKTFSDFGLWYFIEVVLGVRGFGSDWLGLFPNVLFVFFGGFVGETLYREKKSVIYRFFPKEEMAITNPFESKAGQINMSLNLKLGFITYPGKHTFFIYIFHQPMIILFFLPLFLISGVTFKGLIL